MVPEQGLGLASRSWCFSKSGIFSFLLHASFISIFRHHATVCNFRGDSVRLELDGRGEHGRRLQPGQRRPPEWGQPGEHHQQRSVDHQPAHLVTRFSFYLVPLFGRCEPQQWPDWPVAAASFQRGSYSAIGQITTPVQLEPTAGLELANGCYTEKCKTRTTVLVPLQKEKLTGEAADDSLYLFVAARWIKIFAVFFFFYIITPFKYAPQGLISGFREVFNCWSNKVRHTK